MRDSNYTDEQLKMTAPSMRLTRIMTKFLIQYIYVVCLISSLDVITQCQCSQSANTQISDSANGDAQQRKVPDGIESITTFTNLIGEPSPVINYGDQFTKEFQYYEDPSVHTTLKYEPPSIEIPNNHKPVHELDLNESYFPLEPLPYIPGHNFIPPPPPPPKHYLKVKEPFWMPEVVQLENQYIDTFRSIKSSVMNFYYRMQNFVNYFVNMFSFENTSLGEGRGKKLKIKKKFKKFLVPLLIAYKLKFFALIPILIGGLVLLVGSTGMAGFFFALFAAVISLKGGHH